MIKHDINKFKKIHKLKNIYIWRVQIHVSRYVSNNALNSLYRAVPKNYSGALGATDVIFGYENSKEDLQN